MAESMTPGQIIMQEMHNTGTTWTRDDFMEKHGYLVIKNLWDPEELSHPVPIRRGQFNYRSKNLDDYDYEPLEKQVEGSVARYWHPQYRTIHSGVRGKAAPWDAAPPVTFVLAAFISVLLSRCACGRVRVRGAQRAAAAAAAAAGGACCSGTAAARGGVRRRGGGFE